MQQTDSTIRINGVGFRRVSSGSNGLKDVNPDANTVGEDAVVGDLVGITVQWSGHSEATFELTDNASGRFAIDSDTGVITVSSSLTPGTYRVTVLATDAELATQSRHFAIRVTANITAYTFFRPSTGQFIRPSGTDTYLRAI